MGFGCLSVPARAAAAIPAPAAAPAPVKLSPAKSSPAKLSPSQIRNRLTAHYKVLRASFWRAEKRLLHRAFSDEVDLDLDHDARYAFFAKPLEKDDALAPDYRKAAAAADGYIALSAQYSLAPGGLPTMLYLGAIAHYTLGENARALQLFEELRDRFPEYKREQYFGDDYAPDPTYSVPIQAGIAKLIFFLRLQNLPQNPPNAFAALRQITSDALTALSSQREYAAWVASFSDRYNIREFDEGSWGSEPDQRRAAALPPTLRLVERAWDALIVKALGKAGAAGMRQFLRTQAQPGSPLQPIALRYLQTIDGKVIEQYFAEAQNLLNAKNFDGARAKYRQIMAEYAETDAAVRAESALPGVQTQAVAFYKVEGEKSFQPVDKAGVPQTKSREYFEKLLKEDPDSDVGAYYLARSLATENKLDLALARLQSFEDKHPTSSLRAAALFQQGFLLASRKKPEYDKAVAIMDQVAKEYSSSPEAPEALFYAGTYLAWQSRFPEAVTHLG